ncbi:LytS/YhcK type 5TM receptor domain-containing protein [Jannaschia seohaensis]|uniref:5TMR of 5TMR-LYT n=1 Tax=Jannaschia seohaensis TaxID=475081 RepID=A0A2Y9A975_9RHOB|nr:LytS/YhcK type 5TM receptor domain-containing protein [Jannaschia seohaensis]PWJ22479.1 5TMR-LYT protein [Jannaschia seohaensis]SSA38757.1 5TMR of 5TMR-LYT [Jannaschia seohaensis]
MINQQALLDFAVSIGLLTLLVACYGILRRRLPGTTLAPQLLGLFFGSVALLMMQIPLEIAPGVIVDLRVVPIVLAGAFLGLRGAVIAVVIATVVRIWIGGTGWMSGVSAVWLAAAAGLGWSVATLGPGHRPLSSFLVLALLSLSTLAGALLLPAEIAAVFYARSAPLLTCIYLTVIPALALLLERQRVDMQREAWARAAVGARTTPGFEGPEALARSLARAESGGRFRDGAVVLSLRFRSSRLALSLWGADVEIAVLRELRDRIAALLPPGTKLGMIEHGTVLVFLEQDAVCDATATIARIREGATAEPIAVPGMASVRLRMDGRAASFNVLPTFSEIARAFDPSEGRGARAEPPPAVTAQGTPSGVARLFNATDRLFEVRALRGQSEGERFWGV